jgi:hypothetical protein
LIQRLPITVLELHTVIQVIYAVIIYWGWWDKPLDVAIPIILPVADEDLNDVMEFLDIPPSSRNGNKPPFKRCPSRGVMIAYNFEFSKETADLGQPGEYPAFHCERRHRKPNLFQLFARAACDIGYMVGYNQNSSEFWCTVLAIINGAAHALAWTYYFPTEVERQFYHAACIGTGVFPFLMLLLVYNNGMDWHVVNFVYTERTSPSIYAWGFEIKKRWWKSGANLVNDKDRHRGVLKWLGSTGRWVVYSIVTVIIFLFLCSMYYLHLAPLFSVRRLEKDAYGTVEWAEMFPHI